MQRNPPIGVIVIAIWAFLGGVALIFSGLLNWIVPGFQIGLAASGILIGLLVIGLGVFWLAVGWGLLQLRNWARIAAIVLAAINLIMALIGGIATVVSVDILFSLAIPGGVPGWAMAVLVIGLLIMLTIHALIIWYLLKPDVARAFEGDGFEPSPWAPPMPGGGLVDTEVAGRPGPMIETEVAPPPPPPPIPIAPEPMPIQRTVADRPAPAAAGWLLVRGGQREGRPITLSTTARTLIGRDGSRCELIMEDPAVSAEHACVQWENGQFILFDLASRNGTFVNDTRVQRQPLLDGDVIRIGNTSVVFKSVL